MQRTVSNVAGAASRRMLCVLSCAAFLAGCGDSRHVNVKTDTEYQAVLLTNGHLFFGKLENAGSAFPVLRDVYYIQSQVNPDTKQVANTLLKRGREMHRPTVMYLNAQHIVIVESVGADSQVAQLISQAKQQPAAAAPKAEK